MNYKTLLHLAMLAVIPFTSNASGIPDGYTLQYEQDFGLASATADFAVTDPKAWKRSKSHGDMGLELSRHSKYVPPVTSPLSIALIRDRVFGDFVMDLDLQSSVKAYAHQDMCLFFGFVSPGQYYYTHIALKPDPNKATTRAHDIFVVNNAPRVVIGASAVNRGITWGKKVWHKVRIVRRLADGAIEIYFDDMTTPIMVGIDFTFGAGYVGFGSFDDTGSIDNIKIYAPAMDIYRTGFFSPIVK